MKISNIFQLFNPHDAPRAFQDFQTASIYDREDYGLHVL